MSKAGIPHVSLWGDEPEEFSSRWLAVLVLIGTGYADVSVNLPHRRAPCGCGASARLFGLAERGGSMGVRGVSGLGCRLLYAARGAGLVLLGHLLLHIVHVLGEGREFDIHSVLLQFFSDFSGTEAAFFHVAKRRIKGTDGLTKRHFVVAFKRLFLVLKVGKFRYNLAEDLSIGRHSVFIPFDVCIASR